MVVLFFYQSVSVRVSVVGLRPSSSMSTSCMMPLKGDYFSATLAQDRLTECDQSGKNPLKYNTMAKNWTRATGRTDSEIHSFSHWAIMTRATGRTDSELSHWAIMTRATGRADSELSHWAIMARATGRTDSELSHWAIMTSSILSSGKLSGPHFTGHNIGHGT